MTKQIKVGFDKIPVPSSDTFEQLYDLNSGVVLKTSEGKPLFTREISPVKSFGRADKSTSVVVNNDNTDPLTIAEVFAETSEVSSSLLGVPRAETQLSLFADVSTYGLDENNWEYFNFSSGQGVEPSEWSNRRNKTYGDRFFARLDEVSNEQALTLTAFPVPYSFPYGPKFEDIGFYNETAFERYKKFIELGNFLYDVYVSRGFINFAEENFLNSNFVNTVNIDFAGDVFYNESEYQTDLIFEKIESWTMTWMKIRDGELFDPQNVKINFPSGYDSTNNIPGYSSQRTSYAQLESRRVFRYQPGRISGFTFGIRASTDPGSLNNIIEWGCCNDSDEYVFQIKGSQFNIVRRSAIPLPKENIERMGLSAEDQVLKSVSNPLRSSTIRNTGEGTTESDQLHELVIPRDFFNGDALDGSGLSGYIISFEEVTMYKIEFSWYGAVGAKFYAYIPSGNAEARWVLIHTIVIENQLGQPCLKDPFFKFRYTLLINDTSNLRQPQYIYKYGASYYIDGGDEGTTTIHNYSSNIVQTEISNSRSVLGIKAKDVILNSVGTATKNRKDIIPQKLFVTSSSPAKIDIIDCEGCPGGFGFFYAPSLAKTAVGKIGTLTIASNGTTATFIPNDNSEPYLPEFGTLAKIINNSTFSTYLDNEGKILRRIGNPTINNNPLTSANYTNISEVRLPDGTIVNPKGYSFPNTRLSEYTLAVSSVQLSKENVSINFLNPYRFDNSHIAEFFIGVTNKTPTLDLVSGELLLNGQTPSLDDVFFAEFAQYSAAKNREGIDVSEWDPRWGIVFDVDPIVGIPPGVDSGICSKATVKLNSVSLQAEYSNSRPITGSSGNYLIFDSALINSIEKLAGGEVGIPSEEPGEYESSGVFFITNTVGSFNSGGTIRYFIEISGVLPDISEIAIRFLDLTARYIKISKAFSWNVFPLYVVIGMRDNAKINNITLEESDQIEKFTHTPTWLTSEDSSITVINSGNTIERTNPTSGLFESGGVGEESIPPANFKENYRLDSAQVDTQLQQPLRPGEVRSSIFVGENETVEFDLSHVFGADRYIITPGSTNTKATFITARSLEGSGEVQIAISNKEQ